MTRGIAALAACLAAALVVGCGERSHPDPQPALDQREADYVGAEVCSGCHLGTYASFSETGMARSVGGELPDPLPEGTAEGGTLIRVGSGNHALAVGVANGSGWTRVPFCWYAREQAWRPCPNRTGAGGDGASHVTGVRLEECLTCHAAVPRDGAPPAGVDCERCHGPGSTHVERWRDDDGGPSDGKADPTIVHPRRLAHAERMAVCLQCHLGDRAATERLTLTGERWYRPGSIPAGWYEAERAGASEEQRLRVASQGRRLLRSACYLASEARLDCLNCHNPHVTVYHEDRPADLFRQVCVRCHATDDCAGPAGRREATDPPDDCVECHMPRVEPADLPFTAFTDHWIR